MQKQNNSHRHLAQEIACEESFKHNASLIDEMNDAWDRAMESENEVIRAITPVSNILDDLGKKCSRTYIGRHDPQATKSFLSLCKQ